MKRIFGAKKEQPKPVSLAEATDNLAKRGDVIDEKIRKLDEQLLKHREEIRRLRPGPAQDGAKRRALAVLKQKRIYEGHREQLYGQQGNVDGAAMMLEGMQTNIQVMAAMTAGNKELKNLMKNNKELQVDNVWKTMDDLADFQTDFDEIQEAMGSCNAPVDVDEDELMGELDALGDEVLAEGAGAEGIPSYLQDLPEAPTGPAVPAGGMSIGQLPAAPAGVAAVDEFDLPAVSR